jgi:hypothetical protein
MTTTQEVLTLRIGSQTKANGQPKQTGTFRALTLSEVRAWATPVSEPCSCVNGKIPVQLQDHEHYTRLVESGRMVESPTGSIVNNLVWIRCNCEPVGIRYRDITPSHVWFLSITNDARQAKVNGKVRTWKRDLTRIEVPVKYGLYEYYTFDKHDIEAGRLLVRLS